MNVDFDEHAAARLEAVRPGRSAVAVAVEIVTDAAVWADLVARAPMPHLPQIFGYGEGKAATGWAVRRVVFRIGGKVAAFASVLEKRVVGLRIVARVNRGPVFLEASPSPEWQRLVYAALRQRWRGPLLIAPALESGDGASSVLRAAGFLQRQRRGWLSGRIDLLRDEADIRAGFTSTFRNRVRAAEKAGAELRVASDSESFEWMLARHAENMRDKGFNAVDAAFLRPMRAAAPEAVTVFQLIHGGKPVAGMTVVQFGRVAEYHIGWFGPEGRKLNAGNFLMWNIIRHMKQRGAASFDVGGMKLGDGYTRFKRTMNPAEYELAGEWVSF